MSGLAFGIAGCFAIVAAILAFMYDRARRRLQRFAAINDVEKYRDECQAAAAHALSQRDLATAEVTKSNESIATLKQQVVQYQHVVKNFKSAAELQQYVNQLSSFAQGCRTLAELSSRITEQKSAVDSQLLELQQLGFAIKEAREAGNIKTQIQDSETTLAALKDEIRSLEDTREMQLFGFYHAKYDFDSSERYKKRLDEIQSEQERMIKEKTAATCDVEWRVEGSAAKGRKMINDQIKLVLRAFNGECDAAIAKARYDNMVALEKRIQKSYEQINKMGEVNQVSIARRYFESRLQELYLSHEWQVKKQEEKEEQKRIRDEMREQEKVEREIEKAKEVAEKDETITRNALDRARAELFAKQGQQTEKLEQLVTKLETELKDAIDRKAKAIARAQLTRSGHVYILSNVGSFGQNIYKIGMTRRLEPLERVRELGDASVPFLYDVHALIYSEDAPALETKLHRHFSSRQVNMVNHRREFFRVTLDEVREAVNQLFGEVTFRLAPEAAQYRETLSLLAEAKKREQSGPMESQKEPAVLVG